MHTKSKKTELDKKRREREEGSEMETGSEGEENRMKEESRKGEKKTKSKKAENKRGITEQEKGKKGGYYSDRIDFEGRDSTEWKTVEKRRTRREIEIEEEDSERNSREMRRRNIRERKKVSMQDRDRDTDATIKSEYMYRARPVRNDAILVKVEQRCTYAYLFKEIVVGTKEKLNNLKKVRKTRNGDLLI